MSDTMTMLPDSSAGSLATVPRLDDRWRPTRAGIVGLWRYWDETRSRSTGAGSCSEVRTARGSRWRSSCSCPSCSTPTRRLLG